MSAFKDVIQHDIKAVFQNADEHAELSIVEYDGEVYNIPIILDRVMQQDRTVYISSDDHAQGVYLATATMYAALSDLGFVPKNGKTITINGETFRVVQSTEEMGQVICGMEAYAE